ncbi:MAG TPA: nitronate monooxygenase, partial [Holophagaceae bacterium]|nr:nitronate monooxygenase [Holophagaceae bacterium]
MDTAFTRALGLEVPIIQGPFGGGFSTPQLAAAVSNGGGLGSFGAQPVAPEDMAGTVARIRALTARPFAVNLWVSTEDAGTLGRAAYDAAVSATRPWFEALGVEAPPFPPPRRPAFREQAQALLEAEPPVLSFIFGLPPPDLMAACRRRGIPVLGTATTVAEAKALEEAGVDVVVASGFEAGGHRGSFLEPAERSLMGTFALVPQVVDSLRIPVVAAGGVSDARGVSAALALGAAGVQVGSAFLACEESGASALHRERLRQGPPTALTRHFSGRLARGARNRFTDRTEGLPALPYPFQGWLLGPLFRAAAERGDPELQPLWGGQATALLRHTRAAELLAELASGVSSRPPASTARTPASTRTSELP